MCIFCSCYWKHTLNWHELVRLVRSEWADRTRTKHRHIFINIVFFLLVLFPAPKPSQIVWMNDVVWLLYAMSLDFVIGLDRRSVMAAVMSSRKAWHFHRLLFLSAHSLAGQVIISHTKYQRHGDMVICVSTGRDDVRYFYYSGINKTALDKSLDLVKQRPGR